jgi:hypothetical protein
VLTLIEFAPRLDQLSSLMAQTGPSAGAAIVGAVAVGAGCLAAATVRPEQGERAACS